MKMIVNILFMVITISAVSGESLEQQLINHLLVNVTKSARPLFHPTTTINATFGMELIQLVKVNDREQLVTTKVWIRQKWTTEIFKWNKDDWKGIAKVQVDADKIWTPDIVLYNNGEMEFSGGPTKYKTLINIYSDGKCTWLSPATFTSRCDIDIRNFPFDRQDCVLKFGSWTFNAIEISLKSDKKPIITSLFTNSSQWTIAEASVLENKIHYECCTNPYNDVTYKIVIVRKPLYYMFNVIAPCVVLVMTILFGFFLPPESGERISLTITILLAVAVFLQLVSDALPKNSDSIPMLAMFYMIVMTESAFSLITTCIVLVFHHRGLESNSTPMPTWVKRFFLERLAKYLRVERHNAQSGKDAPQIYNLRTLSDICNGVERDNNNFDNKSYEADDAKNENSKTQTTNANNSNVFDTILKEIKEISSSMKQQMNQEEEKDDWKFLARVLDRLFFWLFFLTITTSCLAILVPVYFINN